MIAEEKVDEKEEIQVAKVQSVVLQEKPQEVEKMVPEGMNNSQMVEKVAENIQQE